MKSVLYIPLLLIGLLFLSCSKENDGEINDIAGTWEVTSITHETETLENNWQYTFIFGLDEGYELWCNGFLFAYGYYSIQGDKVTLSPIHASYTYTYKPLEASIFRLKNLKSTTCDFVMEADIHHSATYPLPILHVTRK